MTATTDQKPDHGETKAEQALDWSYVEGVWEARKSRTKEVRFQNFDGKDNCLVFTIRPLSQGEIDAIEDEAVIVKVDRHERDVRTDAGKLKREFVRKGVVATHIEHADGSRQELAGFKRQPHQLQQFPPIVRDKLADAIERFDKIDAVTEVAFEHFR